MAEDLKLILKFHCIACGRSKSPIAHRYVADSDEVEVGRDWMAAFRIYGERQREENKHSVLSPNERAAASAEWSRQLREKVAASKHRLEPQAAPAPDLGEAIKYIYSRPPEVLAATHALGSLELAMAGRRGGRR